MCTILAAHMPWLPPTPATLGLGAKVPDRSHHGPMPRDGRGVQKEQRCLFCSERGHSRRTCPELAQLRNAGGAWVPPKRRAT